ncbi:uncharacterized protein [Alexandromys fortis]|uniref:uncharacterized protein n=1 Tax=Alexandromys fortis TaxID=100897 RepID=UPI002152C083|nr:uncharacterized protein LOC126500833 [Microtus fortis]
MTFCSGRPAEPALLAAGGSASRHPPQALSPTPQRPSVPELPQLQRHLRARRPQSRPPVGPATCRARKLDAADDPLQQVLARRPQLGAAGSRPRPRHAPRSIDTPPSALHSSTLEPQTPNSKPPLAGPQEYGHAPYPTGTPPQVTSHALRSSVPPQYTRTSPTPGTAYCHTPTLPSHTPTLPSHAPTSPPSLFRPASRPPPAAPPRSFEIDAHCRRSSGLPERQPWASRVLSPTFFGPQAQSEMRGKP